MASCASQMVRTNSSRCEPAAHRPARAGFGAAGRITGHAQQVGEHLARHRSQRKARAETALDSGIDTGGSAITVLTWEVVIELLQNGFQVGRHGGTGAAWRC